VPRATVRRWLILGGTLLATVIAAVWPRAEERAATEVVAPAPRAGRSASVKEAAPAELPQLAGQLERAPSLAKVEDLFPATSWEAEQRAARQAPAVRTAPPFPYAVAGTLLDARGLMVVFARDNQDFVARAGDLIDEDYRVEALDAGSVTVRHLPTKLTQVLPIGAAR